MKEAIDKMYFYENFAESFDSVVSMYDTEKRLSVVFDDFLLKERMKNKKILDAGCGTGWFSSVAEKRGAIVTSMDLGPKLLEEAAKKTNSKKIIGSILEMPFKSNSFDIVISSEVIEHTPSPQQALKECYRVLKPGGILVVTTPNAFWYFALYIAEKLKLRPYQGLENWSSFNGIKSDLKKVGFNIQDICGIHFFPFTVQKTHWLLDFFHLFRRTFIAKYMVNIAVKASKPIS